MGKALSIGVRIKVNPFSFRKKSVTYCDRAIGVCTDICVISNALLIKAFTPNTPIGVIENCCAGTSRENHEAALQTMRSCQIEIR